MNVEAVVRTVCVSDAWWVLVPSDPDSSSLLLKVRGHKGRR